MGTHAPPEPRTGSQLERAFKVCDQIAAGGPNSKLHKACSDHGMSWQTFWYLKAENETLAARYAHARSLCAQWWRDREGEAAELATPETVQVARLQVDSARWQAKMADPKAFGDKLDVTSDGKAIAAAVVVMPPEQIPEADYEVVEAPEALQVGDGS